VLKGFLKVFKIPKHNDNDGFDFLFWQKSLFKNNVFY
jgi:hypothetical protein